MGLFLAMSGVANANRATVEDALRAYATEKGGTLETVGPSTDLSDALLIADSGSHVTVMYPSDFMKWDEASEFLSRMLGTSVVSLHIHDEDLWMYVLFAKASRSINSTRSPIIGKRRCPRATSRYGRGTPPLSLSIGRG